MLLSPFVALALAALVTAIVTNVDPSRPLREGVFNRDLESKIRTFIAPDTEVIIGGDSRAERQVIPAIIEARTGRRTVNIATTACDLFTLYNGLKKYGILSRNAALIVSASILQVNDGAIDPGYISAASVLDMTLLEKVGLFKDDLRSLLVQMMKVFFRQARGLQPEPMDNTLRDQGFLGINGNIPLPLKIRLDPENTNHAMYRNLALHGARWRVFRDALDRLAATRLRIYIYIPPASPVWRTYTAGTFFDRGEREFAEMLHAATEGYPNVRVLDFYSEPDARLNDNMYYDIQHVNRAGAAVFTEILMERIGDELRTGRMGPSEVSADPARLRP